MTSTVLCCDVGTTQVKAAVFDSSGSVLASARRQVPVVDRPHVGRVQDPELFVSETVSVFQECQAKVALARQGRSSAQPQAVVFTGQQAGLVLVDDEARALSPYDSWLDTAYKDVLRALPEIVERGRANCGSRDFMHLPKLLRQRALLGDAFDRATTWTVAAAYVAGRLAGNSGRDSYIDIASISYSGMADLETLTWDDAILEAVGLPAGLNPRIARPSEIVGSVSADFAERVDVPAGLPIFAGVGDFPAATLGGQVPNGHFGEILGTASMSFGVGNSVPRDLPGTLRVSRAPLDDLWLTYDLVPGGDIVRWFFEDVMGRRALPEAIAELASDEVPDDLWFIPFGAGVPHYGGPWGWIGLTERVNRSGMYRALLDGLAFEQEWTRRQIESVQSGVAGSVGGGPVHVLGGSGAGNQEWLAAKADIAGHPFGVYDGPEDPALVGAAIIGGLGLGWARDAASLASAWSLSERDVVPDAGKVARAQERFGQYLQMTGRDDLLHTPEHAR